MLLRQARVGYLAGTRIDNFSGENHLKIGFPQYFLDIDEKILNYLMQVKRGGFDLMP